MKRILFLVPYPLEESPSQRFRFEQYFDLLTLRGFQYSVESFLTKKNWKVFFQPGSIVGKISTLFFGLFKRTIVLFNAPMYDFVFIHREAAPVGPPVFEWILATILRRKIIYDFDDAIWLTDRQHESLLVRIIKARYKVRAICKWSYKISCGNDYLCDYARRFNRNVVYNPTTIDTENLHNPDLFGHKDGSSVKVRIGWTGSHSTLKYLKGIEEVLRSLMIENPVLEFAVIADVQPDLSIPSMVFLPWNQSTEIESLSGFDIGIMPLPDDMWAKGKCGFKALQYMAMKIPAVAAPVGVNLKIIDDGVNGFLCSTSAEWETALRKLIANPTLRKSMGKKGREKVIENYSVRSNADRFLSLFE